VNTQVWAVRDTGEIGTPPYVGRNDSEADLSYAGIVFPEDALGVHPPQSGFVVVSWLAPVAGVFDVEAHFASADDSCGDGIEWAIQKAHPETCQAWARRQRAESASHERLSCT